MENLQKTVADLAGKHTRLILTCLSEASVSDWHNLNSMDILHNIREAIVSHSNSGSVYAAKLCAIIGRYQDQLPQLPRDWRKALAVRATTSQQTFLSMDDIRKLIAYRPKHEGDKFIQMSAIIELRTGTRISDAKNLDERNLVEDSLCYVSQKTKKEAFIPSSDTLLSLLQMRRAMGIEEYTDEGYNKALKRILADSGVTDEVKLFRRGEFREEEKFEATTSHSLRRTFCTQLHLAGEDIYDIMTWAGHRSIENTQKYIRAHRKPASPRWNFFEVLDQMIRDRYEMPQVGIAEIPDSNPLSKLGAV